MNMLFPKLHKSLILGVAVALVATACTKKVDDKDTTLNIALKANVKGLDPIRASDLYSSTVIGQLFDGLLEYHHLKRPFALQPAMAEAMPEVSKDGLTYTFKIKKGVRFADDAAFPDGKGREVTAEDFIYSWKRLADPRNASEGFWIFDGKIKGLNEWATAVKAEKADYSTPVEGLQAPDKHTLVVKLTQPYHQMLWVLAMTYASVVAKEAVDKYGAEIINHPVGTGPFKLENWTRNSKIEMVKNPNYREDTYPTEGEAGDQEKGLLADAGQKVPFVEKLVMHEITEDQPRWQNFMKGNIDIEAIPKDNFDNTVKDNKLIPDLANKGITLDITPNLDVTYIAFNNQDKILSNKNLRHAIALANDVETSIQKFYNGRAIVAHSPIPPGIDSYDPNYKHPRQKRDIAAAKAALAKAGYPEGKGLPELTYEGMSDATARQQAEFFVQNMAEVGIKVKISANTWPQFQEKIKTGQAQIWGIAWGADYPDAQNFYQLFYGKNQPPGPNDSRYASAAFDKVYEQTLNMPPGEARSKLYHQLRDILAEDQPWIYNLHRLRYAVRHGWVSNYKYNDLSNDFLKYVKIDPKKRAEMKTKL
jgi:oligopeptide transport system substrate-binding protein